MTIHQRIRSMPLLFGTGLLAAATLLHLPLWAGPAVAQSPDRDPRDIALTEEEGGGKDVIRAIDEDCSDDRARCVHIRWERDFETDATVGPLITVNKVWVAKDVETARTIYRDQEKLHKEMPERLSTEYANGPYKWEAPRDPIAEEWVGVSACLKERCEVTGRLDLHQRVVARSKNVVSVIYLFGRQRFATTELAVYFTNRTMERVNPPVESPSAGFGLQPI
ncbi:MAG: hypothetical protein ACKVVP_14350 [Chloroflexota bacterium]